MTDHAEDIAADHAAGHAAEDSPHIEVRELTLAYGSRMVQRGLNFDVPRSRVFVIVGDSGCGKTTLLRSMMGLLAPRDGRILYDGTSFYDSDMDQRRQIMRRWGVMYQSGALWSAMTLAENIALPLEEFTSLPADTIREVVRLKLELVGLGGFEDHYPAQLSGGMRKRAALARAMALDPEILFFDEPSAGLDPISARRLDDLILQLRDNLGATIVVVTHELASIFAIADDGIFLDAQQKTLIARGSPWTMMQDSDNPKVTDFLTRGRHA